MKRDLDNIPDPPRHLTKEVLIPEILNMTPIPDVMEFSGLLRSCYNDGWNEERLNACSEWDLLRIRRWARVTQEEFNNVG